MARMRIGADMLTPDIEWSACDCVEFVWNGEEARFGEEVCDACDHSSDEHMLPGGCQAGALE